MHGYQCDVHVERHIWRSHSMERTVLVYSMPLRVYQREWYRCNCFVININSIQTACYRRWARDWRVHFAITFTHFNGNIKCQIVFLFSALWASKKWYDQQKMTPALMCRKFANEIPTGFMHTIRKMLFRFNGLFSLSLINVNVNNVQAFIQFDVGVSCFDLVPDIFSQMVKGFFFHLFTYRNGIWLP